MKLNEIAQARQSAYQDDDGYTDYEAQDMDLTNAVEAIEWELSEKLGKEIRLNDEQYRVVAANLETMNFDELVNEFLRDIQWSENKS